MRTQFLALIILTLLPRLSMAVDSAADGIWVFEDTTASLSFEDVVAMPDAFVQTTDTNIGFSDSAFWIRVELTNDTNERQTQVVVFDFSVLTVSAYESIGNATLIEKSGRAVAKNERAMPTLITSFPIELMNDGSKTLYFRITSPYGFDLGYEIKSLNQANNDNTSFEKLRFGLFLALLVVLIYNLAAAFISREVVQWLYVAFLFPMVIVQGIEIRSLDIPTSYLLPFATLGLVCGMVFLASLFGQFRFKSVRWG